MAKALKKIFDFEVLLGCTEDTLREFVKAQKDIQRKEQQAEREQVREELEYKQTN